MEVSNSALAFRFSGPVKVRSSPLITPRTQRKIDRKSFTTKWLFSLLKDLYDASLSCDTLDASKLTSNVSKLNSTMTNGRQHDAHEFVLALLDALFLDGANSIARDQFDGALSSFVTCLDCGRTRSKIEKFIDLSLEISPSHIDSVRDALVEFTSPEYLSGENAVECEFCRRRTPARKGLQLTSDLPNVIVLHLKRFSHDPYGRTNRLNKRVSFTKTINMREYARTTTTADEGDCGVDLTYEIIAVICHIGGPRCSSGHYVAYVKRFGRWYLCNDSIVKEVTYEQVEGNKQNPYIFFYQKSSPPESLRRSEFRERETSESTAKVSRSVSSSLRRKKRSRKPLVSSCVKVPRKSSLSNVDNKKYPRSSSRKKRKGGGVVVGGGPSEPRDDTGVESDRVCAASTSSQGDKSPSEGAITETSTSVSLSFAGVARGSSVCSLQPPALLRSSSAGVDSVGRASCPPRVPPLVSAPSETVKTKRERKALSVAGRFKYIKGAIRGILRGTKRWAAG